MEKIQKSRLQFGGRKDCYVVGVFRLYPYKMNLLLEKHLQGSLMIGFALGLIALTFSGWKWRPTEADRPVAAVVAVAAEAVKAVNEYGY
jgi:hypothetical protein